MKRRVACLFILMIIAAMLCACKNSLDKQVEGEPSDFPTVTLKITRDFGVDTLIDRVVTLEENWTIYDLLESNTDLSTDYGGSFVSGIEGIKSNQKSASGKRLDWFYYVNGVCADMGILDYDLKSGDIVWWDYHEWEQMSAVNSTVVGMYPEPFINGYNGNTAPITIMSTVKCEDMANALNESLVDQGSASIIIAKIENESMKERQGPVIVIGEWAELEKYPYIQELNEAYKKIGTYASFSEGDLQLFNSGNQIAMTVAEDAGVVLSHGDGLGDENPIWLIIGRDSDGTAQVVDYLLNRSEETVNMYSFAVVSGKLIRLPME